MTIGSKITEALAAYLESSGVDAVCQATLTAAINEQGGKRVVCDAATSSERQSLRGIYDVNGEVHVFTSIDLQNAIATHLRLCNLVRNLIGDTEACANGVMNQKPEIHIYSRSWRCGDLQDDAGNRGYKSTFSWRAVARDTPSTD